MKQLTDGQRKRMINMLRWARQSIKFDGHQFICHALEDAPGCDKDDSAYAASVYLRKWVMKMLGREDSLQDWLRFTRGVNGGAYIWTGDPRLRQTRIDWLNWMIGELKKEMT